MMYSKKEQEASELNAHFHKVGAKFGSAAVLAGAVVAACPVFAFADGIEAILPKMDEFLPMLVAFIVLWIILAKFGWPLLDGILVKREATIKGDLKSAEEARIEAEKTLAEYKQQLAEARVEAANIVAEAKKAGNDVKADIEAKAQQEASNMISKARATIEAEKKAAVSELQGSVADISVAVAGRLIGNDLSDEEHRAIIKRYVEEAGSFNAD